MRYFTLIGAAVLVASGCTNSTPPSGNVASSDSTATVKINPDSSAVGSAVDTPSSEPQAEGSESATPETPGEIYAAIKRRFNAKMKTFREAYQSAERDDRRRIYDELYPKPQEYAAEYIEFARTYPDVEQAVDALKYVATLRNSPEVAELRKEARATLFEKYADSDAILDVVSAMSDEVGEESEERLRSLISNGATEKIKGVATFSLASYLENVVQWQEFIADNPESADQYGEEFTSYVGKTEVDPAEREALYEKVVSSFAEIPFSSSTLGESADTKLYELRNLQIGMEAPEIEAKDLDGIEFKLSDYRGKVVLLDFWGHW